MFKDLNAFIERLEKENELVRIAREVDPVLEITEIADRVSKSRDGGKALLFEKVKGSAYPVLINAMGSFRRMAMAMGSDSIEGAAGRIRKLLSIEDAPKGLPGKLGLLGEMANLVKIGPKIVKNAPCQEVVQWKPKLSDFPILQCWPKDAGRFITLPLVFTKDPQTGRRNVGMYRMQVFDDASTGMHWQTQKDGMIHSEKAKKRGEKMEVAVAIGADPATVFSAVVPLPYGVDELLFAGFVRGEGVPLVKCKTVDLEVPAEAEIILEGTVDPEDLRQEGPFGDHTGVYTPVEMFPVFRIQCITHRRKPIYLATIVGKPPMEDYYMGKAIERTFLPILQKQIPELVDMNFPMEGTFNNAVICSIDKNYPFQARKVAHAIWGLGQLSFTKFVIVVDKSVDVHDLGAVMLAVFNNIDPKRDLSFVEGPVDTLNHAAPLRDFGSKVCVDATSKTKEEGYTRVWPEEIEMDNKTKQKVDEVWKELGIK